MKANDTHKPRPGINTNELKITKQDTTKKETILNIISIKEKK